MTTRPVVRALALSFLAFGSGANAEPSAAKVGAGEEKIATSETAPIMRTVLDAIKVVLPMSMSRERFQSSESRALVREKLKVLADASSTMREHFASRAKDYEYVAAALAEDSRDALALYDKQNFRQARFIIHHMSTSCFSCHTKMPATKTFPSSSELFADLSQYDIDRISLAQLKAMTRQFDEAIELYEKEFRERPELIKTGLFSEYLKLALRVELDVARVERLLDGVLSQGDLPRGRAEPLPAYLRTAKHVADKKLLGKVSKEGVRELLALGVAEQGQGYNGEGLVYFAAASSVTNRLLNDTTISPLERSELYFLAGKAEARISDSFWFSELENYLEQSIRLAPKAPWALAAYRMLDEEITFGFTGSSGTHIPEDLRTKMRELGELVTPGKPIQ